MTLTCSIIITNDNVAAFIIVGADTGTVIQDNKPNKNAQAQKSKIDYEFEISSDLVNRDCIVVNNSTFTSEAKIEAEITVIETQHHRATIKCRLAEAQSDCDCSFFFSNAVTSPYAKVGNCQKDSTMTMTGALAIDRAAYLRDIDTQKEEAQLYVPKISTYKGEFYLKLQEFT